MLISRRSWIHTTTGLCLSGVASAKPHTPTLDELAQGLKSAHPSLRSLAISHRGQTVLTHHQPGLGDESLHNVASVTKSVVSLLYATAAQRGIGVNPELSLLDVFPQARQWDIDPLLGTVLVKHVLSLSTGFDRLGATVDSDYQAFQRHFYSPHFLQHALTRKVLKPPGDHFAYANTDSHLAALVLQKIVKQPLDEFAREALFAPLGITDWRWARNAQGDVDGAATLQLRISDMLRLGELARNGGMHPSTQEARRIAHPSFITQATTRHVATDVRPRGPKPEQWGYGYLWWTGTTPITHARAFYALGYGGQFIYVAPSLELTVAATTQQISRAEGAKTAALIREQVLPVFEAV